MLDKFWEAAGEKLADRWASTSVPAVIFWLGGLLCWISGHGGLSDLRKLADYAGRQSAPCNSSSCSRPCWASRRPA